MLRLLTFDIKLMAFGKFDKKKKQKHFTVKIFIL